MLIRYFGFVFVLSVFINFRGQTTDIDPIPDLLVEYRIAELDNSTPVSLDFNEHVRDFITIFAVERYEQLGRIIGLGKLYFPVIKEILDRHNLPFEIKYLAIIESALDPHAVSSSGAVGLWQFLLHTARMFDLEVSSYIDERMDVYKSTEAAASYMAYLHGMFGDWHLAFAAYNSGPGVVRNAIIRSGGRRNYWEIRKYLPEQSQRFIPAFIAINYLMNYYEDYQIVPRLPEYEFKDIDTLHVSRALGLKQVSEGLNIPIETLRFLNPVYRLDYIPANGLSNTLVLPSVYIPAFLNNYERIYTCGLGYYFKQNDPDTDRDAHLIKIIHRVRGGDFIHKIAIIYGTLSNKIMEWNQLDDDLIYEGQELIIWISKDMLEQLDDKLPFIVDADDGAI